MDNLGTMDNKKDKNILEQLKKNSRQSVRELSKKTGIRPSTVHLRIKKLIQERIIEKFTIKLNYKKLGTNFIVFILVNTNSNIPNTYFQKPCITEVFGITGEYDLILKCRFKDVEEFNSFVIELRNLPQINKTHTLVGTIMLKEEV